MLRSRLASLLKQVIGRVRRRTSRKALSMALVVRMALRWPSGQAGKASRAFRYLLLQTVRPRS